jgi:glycosyltransferase involved in cell wall biosynthesis
MKVVMILANDFVADPRVEKEAVALIAAGWEVVVLAWDRAGGSPVSEERSGIRVERLGPRASHGAGIRSFPLYRAFWRAAAARARELDPDVVHCHDMDTVPVGVSAVEGTRTRLVLDFHELYRESRAVPAWPVAGALLRAAVDRVEARGLARASLVILAWPAMLQRYARRFAGPVVVVDNAPDLDRFVPDPPSSRDGSAAFDVCYVGQKRYADSLRLLIDIVQRHQDLRCFLAGGGVAADEIARYAEGKQRVEVVGRVRYEEIPALYRGRDAVYALYDAAVGNARIHMPVKVMEAMACGLPVIVSSGTWVAGYVEREGVGLAAGYGDEAAVEAALVRLKDDRPLARAMGERGRRVVEEGLNWEAASRCLVRAYAELAPAGEHAE